MALIIVAASIPIFMGTFSAETLPLFEHFIGIGVDYYIPEYKKLVVFDLTSQVTVGISQLVGVLICILQIISFVCVFRIFRNLSENVQKYSKKSLSLHRQLTRALLLQLFSPFVCIFLPVGAYFMALMAVQLPVSNTSGQIGVVMITIFPLVNASITILFISPFRKYTMSRFQALTQISGYPRKNTPIVVFPIVKNFSSPSA
uniref:Uncharacterized protein n=1 Tax=Panagrolaimus sp. JU765 TaxID=591449 RepID=A0AC34RPY3_9BILA